MSLDVCKIFDYNRPTLQMHYQICMIPVPSFTQVQDVIFLTIVVWDEQPVLECFETNYLGDLQKGWPFHKLRDAQLAFKETFAEK